MVSLFSLRPLIRTLIGTMNSVLHTWSRNVSQLAYLPLLEPCSTTYSKLHIADGNRTGSWANSLDTAPYDDQQSVSSIAHTGAGSEPSIAQQLPYEILVQIFFNVEEILRKEWDGPFSGNQRHSHPAYSGVTLSHVCYRWRSVMLDQSAFWASNVTSFSHAPRDELVRRARGLPLDALLHVWRNRRPFEDPDFRFLRNHICSLRSLALWLPETALPAFGLVLPTANTTPLEELESLEVTLYDASPGVRMQEFRTLPPLRTPSLHTAIFRDCFLFLEAPRSITRLEIMFRRCYRANTDGALLTPAELSHLLTSCTSLRQLHLGDELPLFTADAMAISLPHLERLVLEGSSTRCAGLLEALVYSEDTRVRVRGHNVPSPISLEDPVARVSILQAVEAVHSCDSEAVTTARIFPGMSFELIRGRSSVRGKGVHLAFEHFERGLPIIEVLQMFAHTQVAVHSIQVDHDAALNELCVLLSPHENVADDPAEVPFPELQILQLSGQSSHSVVTCSASVLAVQERRMCFGRPLQAFTMAYPSREWPTIQGNSSIQALERLLSIRYHDAESNIFLSS